MKKLLVSLGLLFLVACGSEKPKPDKTAPLESKIRELERSIEYLSNYTQSAMEERDGKIQQLAQVVSGVVEKVKDLESDLGSVGNNSQATERKLKEFEMELSDLQMKISHLRSESLMNSLR